MISNLSLVKWDELYLTEHLYFSSSAINNNHIFSADILHQNITKRMMVGHTCISFSEKWWYDLDFVFDSVIEYSRDLREMINMIAAFRRAKKIT
jgi:hypothetical protein